MKKITIRLRKGKTLEISQEQNFLIEELKQNEDLKKSLELLSLE